MTKGASRGRCFQKKADISKPAGDNIKRAKVTPKVKLVGIRVIRADGTIEEIQ
jgi:hypothetical protein